jgi:hypothetical protein
MTNKFKQADRASGVALSRDGLYIQRMDEIYTDLHAGRCSFEEAVDRTVEAVLERTNDWFTPKGRAEVATLVRAQCASDPRLRRSPSSSSRASRA